MMKMISSLEAIDLSPAHYILTIGNFDGMHVGHQAILQKVLNLAKQREALAGVITFSNHTSATLSPSHPTPLLCTAEHKVRLMEQERMDLVMMLPFTYELSKQPVDIFLKKIREKIAFLMLVLGSDAVLGQNREGNREAVIKLSKTLNFEAIYLSDISLEGIRISSSKIREYIQQGKLSLGENFLGRKFSIYAKVISGMGHGSKIGFPTANMAVDGLCLPPFGVYAVELLDNHRKFCGIANLGIAPTLHSNRSPVLEVHLFDHGENLYGKNVEVVFHEFIRPEKCFNGVEELKTQIAKDVQIAKQIHLVK